SYEGRPPDRRAQRRQTAACQGNASSFLLQSPHFDAGEDRCDDAAGLSLDVVAYAAPLELTRGQRRREEGPAMDHIGIDVHKRESQICILAEGGQLIEQRLIVGDIKPILGGAALPHYLSYVLVVGVWWWLYRTRPGLHLRACGESPASADAMGVKVTAIRYGTTVAGGALAGLAGGYLSLAYTPAWTDGMTSGLGWIAIALVIFATWNPLRLLAGAYLFGAVDALGVRVQLLGIETSSILLRMLPYLFTLMVLLLITVFQRRGSVPAALGRPYFREV